MQYKKSEQGSIVVLVLVFMVVFSVITSSLIGYIFVQKRGQDIKAAREEAIQIAEAGLDYYKWFLAHYPDDLQDGTGGPGPYVHDVSDPEGGVVGQFSLEITGNQICNSITSVDINATGWTNDNPSLTREVYGRYAQPSVAEYAFVLNSNVWAGSDRQITGRYHSNGGIRMDGTNYSTVSSAVETWDCTSSFGCSGTQEVDGVFGAGSGSALWEFPVPQVDFAGITQDLVALKAVAESDGVYLPQVSGGSEQRGYHIILQEDSTIDVYEVTRTRRVWGYNNGSWSREYNIIRDESFVGSYDIPADCPVVFAEDKVWLEGTTNEKMTLVSADVTNPTYETDLIIIDDIDYVALDGSDGLTAIGQNSVLIPLEVPNNLSLRGIFIAQNGYFGRNYYTTSGFYDVPSSYNSYVTRDTLDIVGTIVSNGRVGTKWTCGGSFCSGYATRNTAYDNILATDPPPLTPNVSEDYKFVLWREIE